MKTRRKENKRKFILYILLVLLLASSGLLIYRYLNVSEQMFTCKTFTETDDYIVKAISCNGNLIIVTANGSVQSFNSSANSVFKVSSGAKIFDITLNREKTQFSVASASFVIYDKNGKEILKKSLEKYIPIKTQFLSNGNYKMLFQSLENFSYKVLTVDKTGKVLLTEEIPDLGEPSSVDISTSGKILFAGERGEIYIIDNNIKTGNKYIEKTYSSINNVYASFAGENTVIVGYKNLQKSSDSNLFVPFIFFDSSLSEKGKISLNSKVNDIFIGKSEIVFSLDSGFEVYDFQGKQLNTVNETDYSAYCYSENGKYKLFVFYKEPSKENEKPIYKIILKGITGEVLGTYIGTYDYPPQILLSDSDNKIFIINANKIEYLSK